MHGDDLQGVRLLLVEDDEGDALLVEEQLREGSSGLELLWSRTLRDALAHLEAGVDCVLLDLGLPDGRGLDTLARVQGAAPGTAVIVLTGLADEAVGVAAVDAGAQDYLVKGQIQNGSLARAIRYAVSRRQAEDSRRRLAIAELYAKENARLERGLLPRPMIEDASIGVTSFSRPGRRRALLGGDFYDVVETGDGAVHALIGDVCGHGPDEAALGVCLRSAWRALVLSGSDGDVVLATMERILEHESHDDLIFATVCTVRVAPESGELRMRRAGHLPPLLIDGGSVTSLPERPAGRPLGLGTGGWPEIEVALPAGWSLLLYTDGLIEGRVPAGGQLGEERLRGMLSEGLATPGAEARGVLEDLIERVEALHGGPLPDDVALLLLDSGRTAPGRV